jgi:hypothetical protein
LITNAPAINYVRVSDELASENASSRQQGKNSISLEKKLQWRYNYMGLLSMLRTTVPLKEMLCIVFGRARRLK